MEIPYLKVLAYDGTFLAYEHEKARPREAEVLQILHGVALWVWPIMRQRGCTVGTLAEFWPSDKDLLGKNFGRGHKIRLRLRHHDDERRFLPMTDILDCVLRELCHNFHDHDDKHFNALWNQLRIENGQLEHDQDFLVYEHEWPRPRHAEALQMLRKVASRVRPILRRRRWTVGIPAELWPSDKPNRLGLNLNRGQKISLRLRRLKDERRFLPLEEVVDNTLQELCHIVHSDRNQQFNGLLEQLRQEQNQLRAEETTRHAARNNADGQTARSWTCNVCTLVNSVTNLCCDACGIQRF